MVPFGSLVIIAIYLIQYFADKFFLLKYSSFHPTYSYALLKKCLILAETSVFAFALGNYLTSLMYHGRWFQPVNLFALGVSLIFTILVWIEPIRNLCVRSHTMYEQSSYSDCVQENKFFHTYYSLNPTTKLSSGNRKTKAYIGVNYPIEPEHSSHIVRASI